VSSLHGWLDNHTLLASDTAKTPIAKRRQAPANRGRCWRSMAATSRSWAQTRSACIRSIPICSWFRRLRVGAGWLPKRLPWDLAGGFFLYDCVRSAARFFVRRISGAAPRNGLAMACKPLTRVIPRPPRLRSGFSWMAPARSAISAEQSRHWPVIRRAGGTIGAFHLAGQLPDTSQPFDSSQKHGFTLQIEYCEY